MTMILAVPARDRIVVMADGMGVDTDTQEVSLHEVKIFALAKNVAALVTGMGLEDIPKFMNEAVSSIKADDYSDFKEIVDYMRKRLEKRDWAENDKSSMQLLIVGYLDNQPHIHILGMPEDDFYKKNLHMISLGMWEDESNDYLMKELGDMYDKNRAHRTAELAAVRTLIEGEKVGPDSIGGQEQLWYVFRNHIEKKGTSYIARLRAKQGNAIKAAPSLV